MWKPRGLHDALDPVEDDDLLQMNGRRRNSFSISEAERYRGHRVFTTLLRQVQAIGSEGRYPAATALSRESKPAVQFWHS